MAQVFTWWIKLFTRYVTIRWTSIKKLKLRYPVKDLLNNWGPAYYLSLWEVSKPVRYVGYSLTKRSILLFSLLKGYEPYKKVCISDSNFHPESNIHRSPYDQCHSTISFYNRTFLENNCTLHKRSSECCQWAGTDPCVLLLSMICFQTCTAETGYLLSKKAEIPLIVCTAP